MTSSLDTDVARDPVRRPVPGNAAVAIAGSIRPAVPRRPLVLALGVAAGWIVLLAVLTWMNASTVTLNREQILAADIVVSGRFEVLDPMTVLLHRGEIWPIDEPELKVTLERIAVQRDRDYLVPLVKSTSDGIAPHSEWSIAPSPLGPDKPLVYPVTDDVLRQLKSIRPEAVK